jgi:hypothetical protein
MPRRRRLREGGVRSVMSAGRGENVSSGPARRGMSTKQSSKTAHEDTGHERLGPLSRHRQLMRKGTST